VKLKEEYVRAYREQGFAGPFDALSAQEVDYFRGELEDFESHEGGLLSSLPGQVRAKTHLLFPWMNELVRLPTVLDAVESLIGPDILVYHVTCWIKEPGDGAYVSWHQDGAYFFLEPAEHVTAWIALSDASEESGCLQVLPGSHRRGELNHKKGSTEGNLLSNGQYVEGLDWTRAELLQVPSGQFTLHDTHLVHASRPNRSRDRRIGIGVSYIPTRVRCTGPRRLTATLVRGEDRFGHFDPETRPVAGGEHVAKQHHAEAIERFFTGHGSERTRVED
jgi:chlorinating enzyme